MTSKVLSDKVYNNLSCNSFFIKDKSTDHTFGEINIDNPTIGQCIVYTDATEDPNTLWAPGIPKIKVGELDDVDATACTAGSILIYDGIKWDCVIPPSGIGISFDQLADVEVTGAVEHDIVMYTTNPITPGDPWERLPTYDDCDLFTFFDDFIHPSLINNWFEEATAGFESDSILILNELGGVVRLNTPGVTSGHFAKISSCPQMFVYNAPFSFTCRAKLGSISQITAEIGFEFGASFARFYYNAAGIPGSWSIQCSNGTTTTLVGPVANTNWHKFQIQSSSTGFTFFIDEVSIGTITTNIPTVSMRNYQRVEAGTTSNKTLDLDFVRIISSRIVGGTGLTTIPLNFRIITN